MSPNAQNSLETLAKALTEQAEHLQITFQGRLESMGRVYTSTEILAHRTAESILDIARAIRIIARDDCP